MAERIHTYSAVVTAPRGVRYRVHADGEANELGSWHGWLTFEALDGSGRVLRTERETTQASRDDLVYWASGLEPVYLDGALSRVA
jgi:hypothetical protein